MEEVKAAEAKPIMQEQETDYDLEALLPRILLRYNESIPNDKETAFNVVKLLSYISVTQQGKSIIKDLGPALLLKSLTFSVDNRIEFTDAQLKLDREYIVGLP